MIDKLTGKELKNILEECGFGFSKALGQNFLCDERILNMIVDDAQINGDTTVLEIGTGAGTLTRALSRRAKRVVSVEVDKTLLPVHEKTLDGFDNVKVINADFLSLDLKKFYNDELEEDFCVAANLPYYITTPIIMGLLESKIRFKSITVLVQREVAARMAALPGTADYGSLTCAVQYYTTAKLCSKIPAACFYPQPKVASQVIRLEKRDAPAVAVRDEGLFFEVVKSAFAMRRKTFANNLMASFGLPRAEAEAILAECALPASVRGEALGLDAFASVADALCKRQIK